MSETPSSGTGTTEETTPEEVYSTIGLRDIVVAKLLTDVAGSAPTYDTVQSLVGAIDLDISDNSGDPDAQYYDDHEADVIIPDPELKGTVELADLPPEVAKVVDTLKVGEVSAPFQMINERGKIVCAIVKLKGRTEGHKATITEDFQVMKSVVLGKLREKKLHDWLVKRIKSTYVRINDQYRDCNFEYEGWVR